MWVWCGRTPHRRKLLFFVSAKETQQGSIIGYLVETTPGT
jgi:hypothetical protein